MKLLHPNEYAHSVLDIDINKLWERGIRNLVIDLEDTLITKGNWDIKSKIHDWLNSVKEKGFGVCLVTNSFYFKKVSEFSKRINMPVINAAFKPFPFAFWRAMKIVGGTTQNTAVIGDQLFMDILGGNFVGTHTILVKHISKENNFLRKMMRELEKKFLKVKAGGGN